MPGSYEWVKDWPKLPAGFEMGNPTGLAIDTSGHLVVFRRSYRVWPATGPLPDSPITEKTILILDRHSGEIIDSWGENLFLMPHGLNVDRNNHVWITDCALHQVMEFTHDGKLLRQFGVAKEPGADSTHFNLPTDIAFTPSGDFYVSDGYGNSRVVKFSAAGRYLLEWGKPGKGPGEFDIPHGITVGADGRVYVADRENNRVQVFDSTGRFIRQWTDDSFGRICAITNDGGNFIAVDDKVTAMALVHLGSDVLEFDADGKLLSRFGRSGSYDGHKCWYHDVVTDKEGNIYVADILENTIQKFRNLTPRR